MSYAKRMARIHRTRRRRNERWYSAWDEASLGFLGSDDFEYLSASWRHPGTRRWMRTWRIIHRYPFGVKRVNWPWIAVFALLPMCASLVVLQRVSLDAFRWVALLIMFLFLLMSTRGCPALAAIRKRRTLLPDLSAQLVETSSDTPGDQLHELSAELRRRTRSWCGRELPVRPERHNNPIATASSPRYTILLQVPFYLFAAQFMVGPQIRSFLGLPMSMITLLSSVTLPIMLVGSFRYFPMLLRRAQRRYNERQCPDCTYDLSKSTPAIAPELLDGQFIGPRRCPECGTHWPLVPPPVPSV